MSSDAVVRFFRGIQLLGQATVQADLTLVELAEDAGVSIPTNCSSGTCGTCMVTLLSGDVPLPDTLPPGLDDDVVEDGARLGCIGCPNGDVDIDVRPPL